MKKQGRAPRARRWAWLLSLGLAPLRGAAAAEEAPDSADDCVRFESEPRSKSIDVHVKNSCDIKLSCNLNYTLRCSTNDGSQNSSSSRRAAFQLAPSGSHELSLSAESCKQAWDIDQIQWTCS